MAKRVFVAPTRDELPASIWQQPIFSAFQVQWPWFDGNAWPSLLELNQQLAEQKNKFEAITPRFIEQTPDVLNDGLHYETRIAERGEIATRLDNWHDLFNAVIWLHYPSVKWAMNQRQFADIAAIGAKQRTRGQYALTQFDEAGIIVLLRDESLLALWDNHDWRALFFDHADAWRDGRITLCIIGHALLEMALRPEVLLAGKCLVVVSATCTMTDAITATAQAISEGRALCDPQGSRPLPLAGIPGWHALTESAEFYEQAPCFRARRLERIYPPPLRV